MRKPCRVLVTGAGSGVGQGIVKALRVSDLPVTVVAGDIAPMNAALYRADEAVIIQTAATNGFVPEKTAHRGNWTCMLFRKIG